MQKEEYEILFSEKLNMLKKSSCLKQEQISVGNKNLFSLWIKLVFLSPLADISCFNQTRFILISFTESKTLYLKQFYFLSKCILI